MSESKLKAYQVTDCDVYAAHSLAEAIALCEADAGPLDSPEDARELTDAELDAPQPEFDEDERQTGGTTSVRQMLREHGDTPGWLCGSEW